MIKALFFDLDGVMTYKPSGSLPILLRLSETASVSYDALLEAYRPFNDALLRGQTTHREIWGTLCCAVNKDMPYSLLTEAFTGSFAPDMNMEALVRELHGRYLTGLITDNKRDRIDTLCGIYPMTEIFDSLTVSGSVGCRKDGEEIFLYACRSLGVHPEECVFTDNMEENLPAPSRLGMKTILFDDKTHDMKAYKSALLSLL